MTSNKLTIAGSILVASLAFADVSISVQYDATYLLPESHGLSCSGNGANPTGTQCPKTDDVAIADCMSYLLSYNGAECVAPVDAQCVLVRNNTWGCAFPQTADAKVSRAYTGEGVNYRAARRNVNCDAVSNETKPNQYGHMAIGASEGDSHGHMTSKRGNHDHMTTDTAEGDDYGSMIHTTESGETIGHDEPGTTKHVNQTKESQQAYPTEARAGTQQGYGTAKVPIIATELRGTTERDDTAAGDDTTALSDLTETPVSTAAFYATEPPVTPPTYTTLTLASQ